MNPINKNMVISWDIICGMLMDKRYIYIYTYIHMCLQFTTNQVQSIPAPNILINEYHGLLRNLHSL